MLFILYIIGAGAVIAYFVGFCIVLIMGILDKQRDTTADNRIVAFLLLLGLVVVPLLGVLTSLPR